MNHLISGFTLFWKCVCAYVPSSVPGIGRCLSRCSCVRLQTCVPIYSRNPTLFFFSHQSLRGDLPDAPPYLRANSSAVTLPSPSRSAAFASCSGSSQEGAHQHAQASYVMFCNTQLNCMIHRYCLPVGTPEQDELSPHQRSP